MKPAETGCPDREGEADPVDARASMLATGCSLPLELVCPYRYRSRLPPLAAAIAEERAIPDPARVARCFAEIASGSDAVLVESEGGLATPFSSRTDFADLAAALNLRVVLVVANGVDYLNSALLSLKYGLSRSLTFAGWILNEVEPAGVPAASALAKVLQDLTDVQCLGVVRHKEPLGVGIIQKLLVDV